MGAATKLAGYCLPGLYVEDYSIEVPLDWRGLTPAALAAGQTPLPVACAIPGAAPTLKLFYRVVCAPENADRELPLLVYLQGGPGGESPRPISGSDGGWLPDALKRFRVVLPDQRGCGRSSRVDGAVISAVGERAAAAGADPARAQADFLKRFLAGSIVRDFEYLRLAAFGGAPWVALGQSYGGFLTLTYLSFFPEGLAAGLVCGGIPHVPGTAEEVYAHTFPRMAQKTRSWYARYPGDEERMGALADYVAAHDVRLPDGSPLTAARLQTLGQGMGMKAFAERLHNLLDLAFAEGDGTVPAGGAASLRLSEGFLMSALSMLSQAGRPLYWTLQEFIYADGSGPVAPIRWAAAREHAARPEFSPAARPLMLTGEAAFPWMFDAELGDPSLKPFAAAMEVAMEDTAFDPLYDAARLAANTVPLHAAVYFDDAYVDSGLQLDTLSRVGAAHPWVTNEFEHDGMRTGRVFQHLFDEALAAGDLAAIFK